MKVRIFWPEASVLVTDGPRFFKPSDISPYISVVQIPAQASAAAVKYFEEISHAATVRNHGHPVKFFVFHLTITRGNRTTGSRRRRKAKRSQPTTNRLLTTVCSYFHNNTFLATTTQQLQSCLHLASLSTTMVSF